VRWGIDALILARVPADLMLDGAQVTVLAHRLISLVVVLALAPSSGSGERGCERLVRRPPGDHHPVTS
jgi:hypothetical protein